MILAIRFQALPSAVVLVHRSPLAFAAESVSINASVRSCARAARLRNEHRRLHARHLAYAHPIVKSTEPAIPANESPHPVTGHNLVAVRMRPVRPLSKGSVAAEPNIQVIRNAYKAELERVQTQGILAGLLFRHFFSGPHIFGVKSFIACIR